MSTTVSHTTPVRPILGPLTTTFTPPADCTRLQLIEDDTVGLNIVGNAICIRILPSGAILLPPTTPTIELPPTSVIESCHPKGLASFYNAQYLGKLGVYSPASICPSGYTVACSQARGKEQSNPFQDIISGDAARMIWDLLLDGESALGCCPINYNCHSLAASLCSWVPVSLIKATGTVHCGTDTYITSASEAWAMRVVAVHVPEHTVTRTASPPPASSVPSEGSLSRPSQGLPLAAKIAIGVVVPLVAILSGVVCFFIYRHRTKRRLLQVQKLGRDARNGGGDVETPKPELQGDDGMAISGPNGTAFRKPELETTISGSGGAVELAELAGGGVSELHGSSSPGELDSTSNGLDVIDIVEQNVDNQHVDERSKGLWQWSSYWD